MKKILFALSGCAIMVMSSCGNKADNSKYTPENIAYGDTVATVMGNYMGYSEAMKIERMKNYMTPEQLERYNKKEFIKGLELVLTTDSTNEAFIEGLIAGINIYNNVVRTPEISGVPIDPKKVIASFQEVYMADTITDPQKYSDDWQMVNMRMNKIIAEKHDNDIRNGEEYKKNDADAQKLLADRKAEGYEATESGLLYKLDNEGKGDKVQMNDRVKLAYKGMHADGSIFDQSEDATFSPRQVVPGFREGLMMLGKGGKGTFVLPADQAYGLNGASGKIGPGEALVFEIEILDINPSK